MDKSSTPSRVQQQIERHAAILAIVAEARKVSLAALAKQLGVSQETIRRDVRDLEKQGRVAKAHGLVTTMEAGMEPGFQLRLRHQEVAKRRLAKALAQRVRQNDSLVFGTGSTIYYAAKALRTHNGLFVVTNSVEIARLFTAHPRARVMLAGGELLSGEGVALGSEAIAYISQFSVEWSVLSVDGIGADGTLSIGPHAHADYLRALLKRGRRVALLVTVDKFGQRGLVEIGTLRDVSLLIVSAELPPEFAKLCHAACDEVIVADG
ncbi:MAG: DeoR/GlpR transcriptional regulator [Pseudorhodoplanes sp.]|nr:DeoR/GlpR transcriptional regulator [Pseudorhodoplanes sp.]